MTELFSQTGFDLYAKVLCQELKKKHQNQHFVAKYSCYLFVPITLLMKMLQNAQGNGPSWLQTFTHL